MGKVKRKTKLGEFEYSPTARRIVPLKAGFCYIFDTKGKLHHVKRESEQCEQLIADLREDLGDARVDEEIARLEGTNAVS